MSVLRVAITPSDEEFSPPSREVEISVAAGRVFITVYEGSHENVPSNREKLYEVPVLALADVLAALAAHANAGVHGVHVVSSPPEPGAA